MSSSVPPRRIAVYARRKDLVVLAYHMTDAGFWLAGLPAIQVDTDATSTELSRIIRDVLAGSGTVVTTPRRTDYAKRLKPVLQALGAKVWSDIERNARLCVIQQEESGELRIIPTRNGGARGADKGFHELRSREFTVPADAFDEVLSAGVRRGLDLSQVKSAKSKPS
ncbi:MAG TPA: hypothetical protein VFP26_14075 [Gemmatimonadaceae bacterium]|nr:hypothetical protein [Gemmatimonadaceae bacterium]